MAKERILVGIDVGSSKITTVVASSTGDSTPTVIGVATVDSKGIRKGQVVDIDEAVSSMSECLEQTERMAGVTIGSAFVTVGGSHISSVNSRGVVAVAGGENEITEDDVQRVTEAARAISIPSSREIIHVIPRDFIVDSQEGIKDPVGMTGVRLEVETNIISGATTSMRNLVKCVQQIGVDVEGLVFSGVSAAESTLTDTEKELGVALVDIGGGTTDVAVISLGGIVASTSIKVAGNKMDTAIVDYLKKNYNLVIGDKTAEDIKIAIGSAVPIEEESVFTVKGRDFMLGLPRTVEIKSNEIVTAISKELREMVKAVKEVLQETPPELSSDIIDLGIIMTGGSSQLRNFPELMFRRTGVKDVLAKDAYFCVAKGTGGALQHLDTYKKSIIAKR